MRTVGPVVIATLFALGGCEEGSVSTDAKAPPATSTTRAPGDASGIAHNDAFRMCTKFVKNVLLSPSSATFRNPNEDDGEVTVEYEGHGVWLVVSTVDAANAFGAKLRQPFSCLLSTKDEITWSAASISLGGERAYEDAALMATIERELGAGPTSTVKRVRPTPTPAPTASTPSRRPSPTTTVDLVDLAEYCVYGSSDGELNLRSSPSTADPANIVATLPNGACDIMRDPSAPLVDGFARIEWRGRALWAKARLLRPVNEIPEPSTDGATEPEVLLNEPPVLDDGLNALPDAPDEPLGENALPSASTEQGDAAAETMFSDLPHLDLTKGCATAQKVGYMLELRLGGSQRVVIRPSAGLTIGSMTVLLRPTKRSATRVDASRAADGSWSFVAPEDGFYNIRAEQSGWGEGTIDVCPEP